MFRRVLVNSAAVWKSPDIPTIWQNKTNMSRQLHARRLENVDKNVWVEFTKLAAEYNVVNLGQGFPDFSPPSFLLESLCNAIKGGFSMHQYTRAFGHPRLVKALAKFFGRILAREIDPMQEILVSVGAYGTLFCAFQALIDEGDEVIIVEPFFDCYEPMTLMAGGKPVYISLKPQKVTGPTVSSADWVLCPEELASKFTSRTKAIIINNPSNPLGKVFQREELQMIADLCIKHDVICISDEVYEWLTYDGAQHIKIASLPGMWERTITFGSAGKSFSATGWKVGWAIGPGRLLKHLHTFHQNSLYHCPTLNQEAVAVAFEREYELFGTEESYFKQLPTQLQAKRLRLAECLKSIGLQPFLPEGGYFMITDISCLKVDLSDTPSSTDEPYDYRFVKWLIKEKRLGTIPVSAFYSQESRADFQNYIRLCFVKVIMSCKPHTTRTEVVDKRIWSELFQLTAEYKAVNLGQGFPDLPPASFVQEALFNAVNGGFHMHQYTRSLVREIFFFTHPYH